MSDSGLKLPTTTELEGRVREALKVARDAVITGDADTDDQYVAVYCIDKLRNIIRILEDGRS